MLVPDSVCQAWTVGRWWYATYVMKLFILKKRRRKKTNPSDKLVGVNIGRVRVKLTRREREIVRVCVCVCLRMRNQV